MKIKIALKFATAVVLLAAFNLPSVFAQGSAFTYQGQLQNGTNTASGNYTFVFSLYAGSTGGSAVAGPVTNTDVGVTNGLFTTLVNFGSGVFTGMTNWLQIQVETNGGGAFTTLSPRQQLTPTPYAIFAEGAGNVTGVLPSGGLSGTYSGVLSFNNPGDSFSGNGGGLTNVNAVTLGGTAATGFWKTTGNAGTSPGVNFLGTTDNNSLELHVNGLRALRLVPTTNSTSFSNLVNVVGGSPVNYIGPGVYGGTIAGGGASAYILSGALSNTVTGDLATIGGGTGNTAGATGATVAGGQNNVSGAGIFGDMTVGGGTGNSATGPAATVAGGSGNSAGGYYATVGGGTGDNASGFYTTVGGGNGNTASGEFATVPGGSGNSASGQGSFAAGQNAQALHDGAFVWADNSSTSPFASTATDQFLIRSSFVGINRTSQIVGDDWFDVRAPVTNGYGGMYVETAGTGLPFYGYSQNGSISAYTWVYGTYDNSWNVWDGGGTLTLTPSGQLGVNTSPTQALEVNGNFALIDGASAADGNGPIKAYIGGDGSGSDVKIGSMNSAITAVGFWNQAANAYMHIYCSSISINGGSDLAEPFQFSGPEKEIPQGSVVVIDEQHPGRLKVSDRPYDTRVAGVVSGANGINPGIQMQQQGLLEGGKNVALTGRVYALADASHGAIHPGDLLTTSPTPGHAMKVTNHAKGQGAILGKAMTGLNEGKGMVLVLVTLQ